MQEEEKNDIKLEKAEKIFNFSRDRLFKILSELKSKNITKENLKERIELKENLIKLMNFSLKFNYKYNNYINN